MVGNLPNFSKMDILRCLLRFNKNISRQDLAKELTLGEGTIRSILEILKQKGLLDSTKKGHFLSKKGNEFIKEINDNISLPKVLNTKSIYPDLKKVGALIRNSSTLKEVYKIRDVAVRNGAEGAIVLKFNKKLYVPESDYEADYSELEEFFELKDNDVLVIAFAHDIKRAEIGVVAIAVEINQFLKKFINEI